MSSAISAGIFKAIRHGLLTGSSVLANAPQAAHALKEWKVVQEECVEGRLPSRHLRHTLNDQNKPLDLGVHLNLSQGRPLSEALFPPGMVSPDGCFRGIHALAIMLQPASRRFQHEIRRELAAQIEYVLDHSVLPTRLDGHQYCELAPVVGKVMVELADRYGIRAVRLAREPGLVATGFLQRGWRAASGWPASAVKQVLALRLASILRRSQMHHPDWLFGTISAGGVRRETLLRFVKVGRSRRANLIEVALHPGLGPEDSWLAVNATVASGAEWADPLSALRPDELEWLVAESLAGELVGLGLQLGRVS